MTPAALTEHLHILARSMAAAQADYEARIMSALLPPVSA